MWINDIIIHQQKPLKPFHSEPHSRVALYTLRHFERNAMKSRSLGLLDGWGDYQW